jgi:hypothetical protein
MANILNANIQYIDFSDYYKKKPTYLDMGKRKEVHETKHIFNKDGDIIVVNNTFSKRLRSLIARLPFVKRLYHTLIHHHYYSCGKRGAGLAVILNKIK